MEPAPSNDGSALPGRTKLNSCSCFPSLWHFPSTIPTVDAYYDSVSNPITSAKCEASPMMYTSLPASNTLDPMVDKAGLGADSCYFLRRQMLKQ